MKRLNSPWLIKIHPLRVKLRANFGYMDSRAPAHSARGRHAGNMAPVPALLFLLFFLHVTRSEILTPPYFNLAQGKKIVATATCGDEGPEWYCKLVGVIADHDERVIQGQVMFTFLSPCLCVRMNG